MSQPSLPRNHQSVFLLRGPTTCDTISSKTLPKGIQNLSISRVHFIMTPERWEKVAAIFHGAREKSAQGRAAYLASACSGDSKLRQEVERLISADEQASSFLPSVLESRPKR